MYVPPDRLINTSLSLLLFFVFSVKCWVFSGSRVQKDLSLFSHRTLYSDKVPLKHVGMFPDSATFNASQNNVLRRISLLSRFLNFLCDLGGLLGWEIISGGTGTGESLTQSISKLITGSLCLLSPVNEGAPKQIKLSLNSHTNN